jgi:hypothetical protein
LHHLPNNSSVTPAPEELRVNSFSGQHYFATNRECIITNLGKIISTICQAIAKAKELGVESPDLIFAKLIADKKLPEGDVVE